MRCVGEAHKWMALCICAIKTPQFSTQKCNCAVLHIFEGMRNDYRGEPNLPSVRIKVLEQRLIPILMKLINHSYQTHSQTLKQWTNTTALIQWSWRWHRDSPEYGYGTSCGCGCLQFSFFRRYWNLDFIENIAYYVTSFFITFHDIFIFFSMPCMRAFWNAEEGVTIQICFKHWG